PSPAARQPAPSCLTFPRPATVAGSRRPSTRAAPGGCITVSTILSANPAAVKEYGRDGNSSSARREPPPDRLAPGPGVAPQCEEGAQAPPDGHRPVHDRLQRGETNEPQEIRGLPVQPLVPLLKDDGEEAQHHPEAERA